MTLTEEQAKTRQCPEAMTAEYAVRCLGSGCMAWRWHYYVKRHIDRGKDDTADGGPATGYCGKAGAP